MLYNIIILERRPRSSFKYFAYRISFHSMANIVYLIVGYLFQIFTFATKSSDIYPLTCLNYIVYHRSENSKHWKYNSGLYFSVMAFEQQIRGSRVFTYFVNNYISIVYITCSQNVSTYKRVKYKSSIYSVLFLC